MADRLPTRAEILGANKTAKKVAEVKKGVNASVDAIRKRIRRVEQYITKAEELVNKHNKKHELLVAELQSICKHADQPKMYISTRTGSYVCDICDAIVVTRVTR